MARRLAKRTALLMLCFALGSACMAERGTPLPQPAEPPRELGHGERSTTRALEEAARRYESGIECGTQYLFEMVEIGKQAQASLPDVVAAIKAPHTRNHALFLLGLLNKEASPAVPLLVALANNPDPAISAAALKAVALVIEDRIQCCGCK